MKIGIYARGLSGLGGVRQYIDSMCRATNVVYRVDTWSAYDFLSQFIDY